jgi:hypothetical protein
MAIPYGARHRFQCLRPATRAMLWYPIACVVAAAGFAAWVWVDCRSVRAVASCRSEVPAETLWAFAIVLAIGLVVLGLVWLMTLPFERRRGRARGLADDRLERSPVDIEMPPSSPGHARSGDTRSG